jgi:hypothetical protein
VHTGSGREVDVEFPTHLARFRRLNPDPLASVSGLSRNLWDGPRAAKRSARSASGQIERLPRPGLSARYVIRQETLAGARGNGRDAPEADIRTVAGGRAVAVRAVRLKALLVAIAARGFR